MQFQAAKTHRSNQPLRNRGKSQELTRSDPVAAIVKNKEEAASASAPSIPSDTSKNESVYWVQLEGHMVIKVPLRVRRPLSLCKGYKQS
jgi:hypothetical protein